MASRASRLARGSAWLFLAQLSVVVMQFVYVAVTSRLLRPADFGVYAVAIATLALFTLVFNGGLAQSVMNAESVGPKQVRAFSSLAWASGAVGGIALTSSAQLWANIWQAPASVGAIRLSGVSIFLAANLAVIQGLYRREGRFQYLAATQVVATLVGLGLGAAIAFELRQAEALVWGVIAVQTASLLALHARRRDVYPGRVSGEMIPHVSFSVRVTAGNSLAYLNENMPRLVLSKWFGADQLGVWNRSESATVSLFQYVQTALIQAIYPELRGVQANGHSDRVRRSDLLVMVSWIVMPAACLLALALPIGLPLLLGPGWDAAVPVAVSLAILGGLTAVASTLSVMFETRKRFRIVYGGLLLQLLIVVPGALLAVNSDAVLDLAIGCVVAQGVRHAVQAYAGVRLGALDGRAVLKGYGEMVLFCVALGLTGVAVMHLLPQKGPIGVAGSALAASVWCIGLALFWRRLPPVRLLEHYQVGPFRRK